MKEVFAVVIWHESVILFISTYIYGKTRTKFENLMTPSCSPHHSGPRFVNNSIGCALVLASVIKVIEILSDTKVQTEGIPHGSVVSPSFFTLKINKNVANLPKDIRLQISLYMDDRQISYRHPNWKAV